MDIKAVLFDLHGTLVYVKTSLASEETSDFLQEHRYKVYPQSLDAVSFCVNIRDHPKYRYSSWTACFKRVLRRLNAEINAEALKTLAKLYVKHRSLTLFQDAASRVRRIGALDVKVALITTMAHFCFGSTIAPIRERFDFIMTGYEAGRGKSNARAHALLPLVIVHFFL